MTDTRGETPTEPESQAAARLESRSVSAKRSWPSFRERIREVCLEPVSAVLIHVEEEMAKAGDRELVGNQDVSCCGHNPLEGRHLWRQQG